VSIWNLSTFFDKRIKFLKRRGHPLRDRALQIYREENRNFAFFCGRHLLDNTDDWTMFKKWLREWILEGRLNDEELAQLYIEWNKDPEFCLEPELSIDDDIVVPDSEEYVRNWFFSESGPYWFDSKNEFSGMFWIFVAYAEQRCVN